MSASVSQFGPQLAKLKTMALVPRSNLPRALQVMFRPSSSKAAVTATDEPKNLVNFELLFVRKLIKLMETLTGNFRVTLT